MKKRKRKERKKSIDDKITVLGLLTILNLATMIVMYGGIIELGGYRILEMIFCSFSIIYSTTTQLYLIGRL